MRYFSVHKEELSGMATSGEIYSDGEYMNLPDDSEVKTITLGYSVWEYGESDVVDTVEFYPVSTNTSDFSDNSEAVLDKIKDKYSADKGWENYNW